jgi:hypothetical protein
MGSWFLIRFNDSEKQIAKFQLRFNHLHPLLSFYQYWTRFDSVFSSFGDQCIIVRKSFFDKLGGFQEWLLFEDVCFLQEARKKTKITVLPGYAITSARRFINRGIVRNQLLNGWLLLKYFFGASPQKLNQQYNKKAAATAQLSAKRKQSMKEII